MGMWIQDVDSEVATPKNVGNLLGDIVPIRDPEWSPDDNLIAYSACVEAFGCGIRLFNRNEGTNDEIFQPESKFVESLEWIPDGKSIIVLVTGKSGASRSEVFSVSIADKEPLSLFRFSYHITELDLSPNGKWLAYVSDETEMPEVFVRRISGQVDSTKISQSGGTQPHWRADGKALFYVGLDGSIKEVKVKTNPSLVPTTPKVVVPAKQNSVIKLYEVSEDAGHFLVIVNPQPSSYMLMLNWASRLKK